MVGQWKGGGTHTGEGFDDLPIGSLPPNTGKKMEFSGRTVLKIKRGKITEEIGEIGSTDAEASPTTGQTPAAPAVAVISVAR